MVALDFVLYALGAVLCAVTLLVVQAAAEHTVNWWKYGL